MTGRTPVDWPTRDLVAHRRAVTPDRTAVVAADSDERLSYREYDRRVDERAAALRSLLPTEPTGTRIGLLLSTRVAFATVAFAAMRLGATVVPLNVRLTADELAPQADRAGIDALLCERATEETAAAMTDAPVASVDEPALGEVQSLATLAAAADEPPPPAALDRDDEFVVVFTSGTTGRPKGVRLTVGNLVASATASAFRLGVTPGDRWLCCLPTYHVGGFAPVVRSALYGTTVVIQREFDAATTADVIADRDVTGVSLVPTMLQRLLDGGWEPPASLRFVLLGGAPAPPELIDRCERRGVPVCPTYGTTETASQIATARPTEAFDHEGTVGQPLAFTDVTVVGDDGEPCDPGEPGELVVDGPTVTPGYLDADRTAAAFGERGFHTGDAGYRDADGRLWIVGRLDDRIVTGGENVDPGEVVASLREHPRVGDAAVVGLPDPEWGQRVAALVVPDGEPPSAETLRDDCRERLAGFKLPRTIGFADALPRTASGTVDRERVREQLRGERDGTGE